MREWRERRRHMPPGMIDIGVFDEKHAESHGREILLSGKIDVCETEIESIVSLLEGNPKA